MASRRDELNAYSFARKRTNAAFLKPLPNGSIESAPRPLKAVVPSIVMGVVILVGFGACGILKPVAPQGWDEIGKNVIVGDESTTRYIVLQGKDKQKLLHPILNLSSARLLIDPKFKVVKVKESELDGKIPHGPAIGIPYAPDRLPSTEDADKPKTWAVCNRPGSGLNSKPQQAVFVLGGKDKKAVEGKNKVAPRQALYVEDPQKKRWLVDSEGKAFEFYGGSEAVNDRLRRMIFSSAQPQQVSQEFMDTLLVLPRELGITMPVVSGAGEDTTDPKVPERAKKIGSILQDSTGQKYVVERDGVEQVSGFIANLLEEGVNADKVNGDGTPIKPEPIAVNAVDPKSDEAGNATNFMGEIASGFPRPWPSESLSVANDFEHGSMTGGLTRPTRNGVSCSVYNGKNIKLPGGEEKQLGYPNGVPDMQTWVGDDYPVKIATGANSYVTPGSGLLYTEVRNPKTKVGSQFLITDTGLRYPLPRNNDSDSKSGKADDEQDKAKIHLGYEGTHPPLILKAWSELLSAGPSLEIQSAKKPQSS
ncbi:type VII secretion protein EccB [Streptomyces lydicus]|uniref:Type VII secretion protein EccB n=1 Tax=Streptomyces lydicus TaxID=47763 RepID=A0A3Q9K8Q6_9ACTN|nr:type VII secretion protein EccB [Streptomyces lydicus]AZS74443.1 type VII secretion protein EccB [Streptomyces lydicus]